MIEPITTTNINHDHTEKYGLDIHVSAKFMFVSNKNRSKNNTSDQSSDGSLI